MRNLISSSLRQNRPGVLACSALKECYRQQILEGNDGARIVFLRGTVEEGFTQGENWPQIFNKQRTAGGWRTDAVL